MEKLSINDQVNLVSYQSLLFPYAYNILGDAMQAEDIIQDVLIKYTTTNQNHVQNEKAYLIRSVINNSISYKQLLRVKNETYPGRWLPEPIITESSVYNQVDRKQILEYTLLVLLEKLNPTERAVFILKESFNYSHEEISGILSITTVHSRQLLKRAKTKLQDAPAFQMKISSADQVFVNDLSEAIGNANLDRLEQLLAEDVKIYSDGGPYISASRNIISGKLRGIKMLQGILKKFTYPDTQIQISIVNHLSALIFIRSGKTYRCMIFKIKENQIDQIFIMVNPEKLNHLKKN